MEGNFGGASIFVLAGGDASPAEDATPDATTGPGDSFSVTFTATGSPGDITVVGLIEGSECGDTDHITVTGTLPNTATGPDRWIGDDRGAVARRRGRRDRARSIGAASRLIARKGAPFASSVEGR